MEEHHSILYEPFNKLWRPIFGFDVPDHVIMALLVLLVSSVIFPLASRKFSKDNPGGFQHFLEVIVSGLKGLIEDIIGHGASQKYLYIIGGFACFIFISNIFGLFFFLQPPTGNPNTTFGLGLTAFLSFLAAVSVSLGVLNLLPLPMLDGGHLMYYLFEGLSGRPVSEWWHKQLQRAGIAVVLLMMSLALFNDLTRTLGLH